MTTYLKPNMTKGQWVTYMVAHISINQNKFIYQRTYRDFSVHPPQIAKRFLLCQLRQ